MKTPLVSVLMPSFNHARWVEEAVRSVAEQKGVDFELLVVDDGSSDGSPEILRRLSEELGFDLVLRENRGLVPTLNEMLARARGKYFCSHASDDVMAPGRLKLQTDWLEAHPDKAACFGQIVNVDADGRAEAGPDPRYLGGIPEVSFEELATGRRELHGCSEMIRTGAFRGLGGYDPDFATEDFAMFCRLSSAFGPLPVLPDVVCFYRLHGGGFHLDSAAIYSAAVAAVRKYSPDRKSAERAAAVWKSHWFSALAYSDKREALRMLPRLASFSPAFFRRFPKLFVPKFLLRR